MSQSDGRDMWEEETMQEVPKPGPLPLPDPCSATIDGRVEAVRSTVRQWQTAVVDQIIVFSGRVPDVIDVGYIVGWCISRPATWDQTPYLKVSGGQDIEFRFNPADVMGRRLEGAALKELLEKGVIAIIKIDDVPGPYHLVCSHQANGR